ncbi:MAG: hypothetical protein GX372_01770 [Ignavibacteria bacterium]|jgi:hypothetical protein|nr:hypothetical protein [Ignavibacteria bacterium]
MKIKRISWFLAIVSAITFLFGFSSCSEVENENIIFAYRANGNISASSGDALEALFCIPYYTEAITKLLGESYSMTERDKDVISACDAVFSNHRTKHPTWKGYVEIEKSKIGTSGDIISSVVIKTYKYE